MSLSLSQRSTTASPSLYRHGRYALPRDATMTTEKSHVCGTSMNTTRERLSHPACNSRNEIMRLRVSHQRASFTQLKLSHSVSRPIDRSSG